MPLVVDDPEDLPPGVRWTVRRKAAVVGAVREGRVSLPDAFQRYAITMDEFLAWERALARIGTPGLRATRLQIYRELRNEVAGYDVENVGFIEMTLRTRRTLGQALADLRVKYAVDATPDRARMIRQLEREIAGRPQRDAAARSGVR